VINSQSSVSELLENERLRVATVMGLLVGTAALTGMIAVNLMARGQMPLVPALVAAVALPILFWRVPSAPLVISAFAATGIERFRDPASDNPLGKIPIFSSISGNFGLSGAIVLPIEMLFALALLAWLARGIAQRRISLRPTPLSVGVAVLVTTAIGAELFGLARGAVFNISLWELRPFLYVGITFLLASQLLTHRGAIEAVLWGMVLGTGLKGVVGAERTINTLNVFPRPESILEHDEAFFFSLYILVTVALWVFGHRGRLRIVATALLPFVLLADLGNNRRTAWIVMPVILIALAVVVYTRAARRKPVVIVVGTLLALVSGYVLAFHSSTSLFGSPAHAIWSQFQADPRDQASNLYRDIENHNLGMDIRSSPVLGEGFGLPIPHPVATFDASDIDPLINFIPHNTVLYVWLRMGSVGAVAFWFMIGAAVIAACRLARRPERWFGLVGTVILAAVVGWVFEGWLDKGIVSFRITILLGTLLGALAAATRFAEAPEAAEQREEVTQPVRAAHGFVLPLRWPRAPGFADGRRRRRPGIRPSPDSP
jgi:O-antigen ligase